MLVWGAEHSTIYVLLAPASFPPLAEFISSTGKDLILESRIKAYNLPQILLAFKGATGPFSTATDRLT